MEGNAPGVSPRNGVRETCITMTDWLGFAPRLRDENSRKFPFVFAIKVSWHFESRGQMAESCAPATSDARKTCGVELNPKL